MNILALHVVVVQRWEWRRGQYCEGKIVSWQPDKIWYRLAEQCVQPVCQWYDISSSFTARHPRRRV